jgi:iron complex outermembrane receptor protein
MESRIAYTYYDFYFSDYKVNTFDYSGNELTGIPRHTIQGSVRISFPLHIYLFGSYNYTDKISLTDDNSVYSSPYDLVQIKTGWKHSFKNKNSLEIFVGVDNLFDESYSLGNDLNASGGRYYNPAPGRNFYGGLSFDL